MCAVALRKRAFIYDLDNTIYPVAAIGERLFAPLFELLAASDLPAARLPAIQRAILRQPFQVVAAQHGFGTALTQRGIELLQDLTHEGPISAFPDYAAARLLPGTRFLVTTGFRALQQSKIRGLGLEAEFAEIHIVDPLTASTTKQEVFADLLARHQYTPAEVLVIGDDPESEIKAAQALGIDTVLYDPQGQHPVGTATHTIASFQELAGLLNADATRPGARRTGGGAGQSGRFCAVTGGRCLACR